MFSVNPDRSVRYVFDLIPGTNLSPILLFVSKAPFINLQSNRSGPVPCSRLTNQETDQQRQKQSDSTGETKASRKLTKTRVSPVRKVFN